MRPSRLGSADDPDPLARIKHRITLLRTRLSHDWWARRTTAPRAQAERNGLRSLDVERATRRGHLHGTRFANLDEQRAWLAECERTLALLREGKLP